MPQNRNSKRRKPVRRSSSKLPVMLVVGGLVVAAVVAALALTFAGDDGDTPNVAGTTAEPTWDTSSTTGPRLDVDRLVHDEGSVPYEHEVSATFRVKNTGNQTLTLGRPTVKTLEGC
jgi:hypothetical protein